MLRAEQASATCQAIELPRDTAQHTTVNRFALVAHSGIPLGSRKDERSLIDSIVVVAGVNADLQIPATAAKFAVNGRG